MCALRSCPFLPALPPDDPRFPRTVADGSEEAPWMAMHDRRWRGASALCGSLETDAQTRRVAWRPGGMLSPDLPGAGRARAQDRGARRLRGDGAGAGAALAGGGCGGDVSHSRRWRVRTAGH
jgi:hypothetical protein